MVYGAYHFTILYPGLRFFVNVRRPSATLLTAVKPVVRWSPYALLTAAEPRTILRKGGSNMVLRYYKIRHNPLAIRKLTDRKPCMKCLLLNINGITYRPVVTPQVL